MLTINTNPNISIKSEPVSPNRDRSTPCSTAGGGGGGGLVTITGAPMSGQYPGALRLEPSTLQGRSPVGSLSSNGSSYEGDRDDGAQGRAQDFHHQGGASSAMGLLRPSSTQEQQEHEGANVKRMRLDTWVT